MILQSVNAQPFESFTEAEQAAIATFDKEEAAPAIAVGGGYGKSASRTGVVVHRQTGVLIRLSRVLGVGLRCVLLVSVVAPIALAGCGASSHKTSTAAAKVPAPAGSTANTVNTSTSSVATHVLTSNELPGFKGSRPSVYTTVTGWLEAQNSATQVAASETKQLARLGFVAAARENLNGPSGHAGLSLVEQFKTPRGARSELANERKMFKMTVPGYEPFPVPGIPGAFGYAAEGPGLNLAFASGDYYYLVGEFVSAANARSEATLITAATGLLQRAHG